MAKTEFEKAVDAYEEESARFTEVNKRYNRAVREETLTDDLELEFFRAEKALKEAYRAQNIAARKGA